MHDAARALTPPALIVRVVQALQSGHAAVVPALPVSDTIKVVDANGVVLGTPERAGLRAVQTPQGFQTELLRRAYERAGAGGLHRRRLDGRDASACRFRWSTATRWPSRSPRRLDLLLAEALLATCQVSSPRVGIGTDVHPIEPAGRAGCSACCSRAPTAARATPTATWRPTRCATRCCQRRRPRRSRRGVRHRRPALGRRQRRRPCSPRPRAARRQRLPQSATPRCR